MDDRTSYKNVVVIFPPEKRGGQRHHPPEVADLGRSNPETRYNERHGQESCRPDSSNQRAAVAAQSSYSVRGVTRQDVSGKPLGCFPRSNFSLGVVHAEPHFSILGFRSERLEWRLSGAFDNLRGG